MTVNKLTRELAGRSCEPDVTYIEYEMDGKTFIEFKRENGTGKTEVTFIHKDFVEEFKKIGIEVGTISNKGKRK